MWCLVNVTCSVLEYQMVHDLSHTDLPTLYNVCTP